MDDDDKQFDLDSPAAIREMNERQCRMGMLMQSIGAHALAELQKKIEQGLPLNLTASQARDLVDAGRKMERAALGLREPSNNPEADLPKKKVN
jgi:hypothetical protein